MIGCWSKRQTLRVISVALVLVVLIGMAPIGWAVEQGANGGSVTAGGLGTTSKASVFGRENDEMLSSLRWTGGILLIASMAVGAFFVIRRRRQWGRMAADGHQLEIIDRLALSPKHWACLVRVEGRLLVVGMTADSLRTLALFDDGDTTSSTSNPPTPKSESFWFRPSGDEGRSGVLDDNLAPYRREVTRLRAMLQNPGDESTDLPPRQERSGR